MSSFGSHRRSDWPETPTITIAFDGKDIPAHETDSVASALLASGYRIFNRHSSDNTPRGGFCFVGRCSDCMMIINGQPGTMACVTSVQPGMTVATQTGNGQWDEPKP
jgi:sarcosine oxidase subunit alpha